MRFPFRNSMYSFLTVTAFFTGCGTQSAPVAEINTDDPLLVEMSETKGGLPLLAVPGPDDGKTPNKSGKVTQTAAKSAPGLLPKGLFGKKTPQQQNKSRPHEKSLKKVHLNGC